MIKGEISNNGPQTDIQRQLFAGQTHLSLVPSLPCPHWLQLHSIVYFFPSDDLDNYCLLHFCTGWNFLKSDVTCLKWLYLCEKSLLTLCKASNRGFGLYESPGEHWFQVWMNWSCSQFLTLSHLDWIAPHSRKVTRKHLEI